MERVDLIPLFILACCVLHNICLIRNDDFPVVDDNMRNQENYLNNERVINTGAIKRDDICNNLEMKIVR